ncbi:transposase [Mariniflexile aquimaris]|uniref:Transposase n=1 Tax=Mariniflexile aquimaris TaxID=881009 RepID=A0ABW3BQD9_9FLAO
MKYEPLVEDSYYHIYNCGNNKENLFIDDDNYSYFLKLIKKHILNSCDILSYCLLKNHFHLLIKTKSNIESKVISQSFSNLFNAYSKAINKKYARSGSLFKDRFSRIKIDNEDYLKSLIIYVHTNPVHHNFTNNYKTYKYSSYKAFISDNPTLLLRDFVINLFEDKENFRYAHNVKETNILNEILLE